jgi:FAD:protein FMN transferase
MSPTLRMKPIAALFIGGILVQTLLGSCLNTEDEFMYLQGKTMGTEYHIKIYHQSSSKSYQRILQTAADSILFWVNRGISTYEPQSLVSYFNRTSSREIRFPVSDTNQNCLHHFFKNLEVAHTVYQASDGIFDPTVMKLVNYWGFGYTGKTKVSKPDTTTIQRILLSTGMDKLKFSFSADSKEYQLIKSDSLLELDFGGIGQGYGADQLATYLDSRGFDNYLVELGGELVAKGLKPDGAKWTVGLNTPLETSSKEDVFSRVRFTDKALTTSGNYRNFYKSGEQTYSHTINPKTGYPERSTLLSVTLIGSTCTEIDAMATACMAAGIEKCKQMILPFGMEAYFVYGDGSELRTDQTEGFRVYLAN